ncbi:MAG: hypothetical protein MHMPM18_004460 [Marteilia pararefringens]
MTRSSPFYGGSQQQPQRGVNGRRHQLSMAAAWRNVQNFAAKLKHAKLRINSRSKQQSQTPPCATKTPRSQPYVLLNLKCGNFSIFCLIFLFDISLCVFVSTSQTRSLSLYNYE